MDQLCKRLDHVSTTQEPIDLRTAFAALTGDVISAYSYGESHNSLAKPDFDPQLYRDFEMGGKLSLLNYHFPRFMPILNAVPYWLVALFGPDATPLLHRKMVRP